MTRPVIAHAGRRVDAAGAPPRFPQSEVGNVTQRIRAFLEEWKPEAVVGSAACGSDLLVFEVAGQLGIRRRVILPFEPARFRETSVVDRGPEWGAIYDRVLAAVPRQDLILLGLSEGDAAYTQTNQEILDHAQDLAAQADGARALIVWNGEARGPDDITQQFAESARARHMPVHEIMTFTR